MLVRWRQGIEHPTKSGVTATALHDASAFGTGFMASMEAALECLFFKHPGILAGPGKIL